MDNLAIRRYEMLKRVRDFSIANPTTFADGSLGKQLFTAIAQIVTDLDHHGANQISGKSSAQSQTRTKVALRDELRETMTKLNRTARVLAFETPGIEDKFRLPNTNSDQMLLNAARAFATDAQSHKESFIKHELSEDFIVQLNQQINAFEQALTQQAAAVEVKVSAKVAIDETINRGLQSVRQLDAILRNKFNSDSTILMTWTRASHVERRIYAGASEKSPKEQDKPNPAPSS